MTAIECIYMKCLVLLLGATTLFAPAAFAAEDAKALRPSEDGDSKFVDTHVHFHTSKKGDMEIVLKWMKGNNVRRVMIHPLEQSRPKNDAERKQMLENYKPYKGVIDRFCIFKPEEVNSEEEAFERLKQEKEDGAIGFGEHYGVGLKFDDPKNMRLYAACEKVGLPVMFHMDKTKNLDEEGLPRLERVLKTYPNCTLIAHSDWWKHVSNGTCERLLQAYPNLYADISCTVNRSVLGRDKELARAFIIRNVNKLLFGSDSGWWSARLPSPEFAFIEGLDLPKDVEAKLLRENAMKLFPVETK